MRLFFALYPDTEALRYCRDVYRLFDKEKRNLKNEPIEQLHITMRFVGARVSDHSKNAIIAAINAQHGQLPKPEIKITGLQFGFPRQHDPRVLFANIAPNSELLQLQDILNKTIRKLDFQDTITWKSHQDNSFHLSIARLKPSATRSSGREVKAILNTNTIEIPPPFVAEKLHVVQSVIDNHGKPNYRILDQISL